MRRLGSVLVSDNHYVVGPTGWVRADEHPDSVEAAPWTEDELICLNTDRHTMTIGSYTFRDFDEIDEGHEPTMAHVDAAVNGIAIDKTAAPKRPYR
jgi:hypothetical protein